MKYRIAAQKTLMGIMCLFAVPFAAQNTKVTPLMTKDLAGLPNKEGVMLTVEYAPGASSAKHRHNANTFVYVLEGSIVMQVEGGKAVTLAWISTQPKRPNNLQPFLSETLEKSRFNASYHAALLY